MTPSRHEPHPSGGLAGHAVRIAGSPAFLRLAWILWLGSFVMIYALPVIYIRAAGGDVVDDWIDAKPFPFGDGPWTWDVEAWLPMVLSVLAPTALFRILARRVGGPFVPVRAAEVATHDYRSARPWVVVASPRRARHLVALYAGRLGLAMALGHLSLWVLLLTRFRKNFGCIGYAYVRSPIEYLGFATLLLAAALFHAPWTSRVFDPRPAVSRGSVSR